MGMFSGSDLPQRSAFVSLGRRRHQQMGMAGMAQNAGQQMGQAPMSQYAGGAGQTAGQQGTSQGMYGSGGYAGQAMTGQNAGGGGYNPYAASSNAQQGMISSGAPQQAQQQPQQMSQMAQLGQQLGQMAQAQPGSYGGVPMNGQNVGGGGFAPQFFNHPGAQQGMIGAGGAQNAQAQPAPMGTAARMYGSR